ncbi:phosphinothricin acetyltransferase [Pontibacter ummariensis]|uniref:Phosphinothricin acetyltransferase n=1 Tax=Pontibacter ummariensis TaxID=1610492 RepID=A0A239CRF1_9BACT|nr:GNAT family N-acetyltransferase [Pontibacter ummariensis]PRY14897.1 phosphinothricin acetyltransferase [Pontibacter ummariensis]SNS22074.1 phosphinothricin acetyltransferase [Pontibacter ummariensis]
MIEVIEMLSEHSEAVLRIYAEGLATGQATFNTAVPSWQEWDMGHLSHSRLVAVQDGNVQGWAALSPVSSRYCYRGVAEFSIYVGRANRGKGVGSLLMQHLIEESEVNGIWTLYSSTFPENAASVSLQKKCGFRMIGYREKISCLNGQWRDTVLLERRSSKVGID